MWVKPGETRQNPKVGMPIDVSLETPIVDSCVLLIDDDVVSVPLIWNGCFKIIPVFLPEVPGDDFGR